MRARGRWRVFALWLATAAVAAYAWVGSEDEKEVANPPTVDAAGRDKLRIANVNASEVTAGDAVVVRVQGLDADETLPLTAEIAHEDAEILSRKDDRLVVKVPLDVPKGSATLHVSQGDRRSKGQDLLVRPINRRKLVRNLAGGLALLLLGLRMLSQGFRRLAAHRLRAVLARLTRGSPRAVAVGVVLGGLTQLTTSASGIVIGLLDARLIALAPAIALVLGAQLGAIAMGIFAPVTFSTGSLLLIAVGVAWLTFAADRWSEAVGQAVLGGGLMFYGLHLLHLGFQPLVADPSILPYLHALQAGGLAGIGACALTGVLLSVLLQGPAAVFGLVVGLAESSGALGLESSLAILAGTTLGAGIGTAIVASPSGAEARRLGVAHVALGAAGMLLMLATLPLWAGLSEAVVPGASSAMAYGAKVLLPNVHRHLVIGFGAAQLATIGLLSTTLPWLSRRLAHRSGSPGRPSSGPDTTGEITALARRGLAKVVESDRNALGAAIELCCSGDRSFDVASEHALRDARTQVERIFATLRSEGPDDPPDIVALRRTVVTTLHLQRALEELLRIAELGVERHLVLSAHDQAALRDLQQLLFEGLDAIVSTLDGNGVADLEYARAREIRLNALEAQGRHALMRSARPGGSSSQSASFTLGITELLDACENVGNHLYRVAESLALDAGQDIV